MWCDVICLCLAISSCGKSHCREQCTPRVWAWSATCSRGTMLRWFPLHRDYRVQWISANWLGWPLWTSRRDLTAFIYERHSTRVDHSSRRYADRSGKGDDTRRQAEWEWYRKPESSLISWLAFDLSRRQFYINKLSFRAETASFENFLELILFYMTVNNDGLVWWQIVVLSFRSAV